MIITHDKHGYHKLEKNAKILTLSLLTKRGNLTYE